MQWHTALYIHVDIALNGCECMVNELTLRLVFDWVTSVKWDNVQQSCKVNENDKENMCRVLARRDKSPVG